MYIYKGIYNINNVNKGSNNVSNHVKLFTVKYLMQEVLLTAFTVLKISTWNQVHSHCKNHFKKRSGPGSCLVSVTVNSSCGHSFLCLLFILCPFLAPSFFFASFPPLPPSFLLTSSLPLLTLPLAYSPHPTSFSSSLSPLFPLISIFF